MPQKLISQIILVYFAFYPLCKADDYSAVDSGNWSQASIWSTKSDQDLSGIPTEGSRALIHRRVDISLDTNAKVSELRVASSGKAQPKLLLDKPYVLETQLTRIGYNSNNPEKQEDLLKGHIEITQGGLDIKEQLQVRAQGLVEINGGILGSIKHETKRKINGNGTIRLNSGRFYYTSSDQPSWLNIEDVEFIIQGGSFEAPHTVLGKYKTSTINLKIIGSQAYIQLESLNESLQQAKSTVHFVLDKSGVSTINVSQDMHLKGISLQVDGHKYSGKKQKIVLFKGGKIASKIKATNIQIVGLGQKNRDWKIDQDSVENTVTLEIY